MRRGEEPSGKCRIYLVTGNKHKLQEVSQILAPYGIIVEQARAPKLEIQAETLSVVAETAALHAYLALGRPLVVDDSGLFIEALNGFPGPYSSYVYSTIGYTGILRLMERVENRRACFRAAVAYAGPGLVKVFHGEVCGHIAYEPRGDQGFGFDPIFIPQGYDKTFAEMKSAEKNAVSHRGRAFRAFAEWYSEKCGAGGGI